MMNKEKYLHRIQYDGPQEPSLDVLKSLQFQHLINIPFENLDVHYGNPIKLDLDKLFDKVIDRKRGGFCFELNGLFFWLLEQFGFEVRRISANVFSQSKQEYTHDLGHLASIVTIGEKEYLTDVGFGEFAFEPLIIKIGHKQKDPRGVFIMEALEDNIILVYKYKGEEKLKQYKLNPIGRSFDEFEEMCHYHQTHPASNFTQKRLITRPTINGRITITNQVYKVTQNEEVVLEETFHDEDTYRKCLFDNFGLKESELMAKD